MHTTGKNRGRLKIFWTCGHSASELHSELIILYNCDGLLKNVQLEEASLRFNLGRNVTTILFEDQALDLRLHFFGLRSTEQIKRIHGVVWHCS